MLPKRLTRHWNHSSVAFLTPADQSVPPQPHHRQSDTQSRQDHAEQNEGFSAANHLGHPAEVHAEEASDEREGKEDYRHERQPIDLIGLALGDGGHVFLENGRRPPAMIVESVLGVLDLLHVVVQLRGALWVHARHGLDTHDRGPDRAAVAIEVRPAGWEPRRQKRKNG